MDSPVQFTVTKHGDYTRIDFTGVLTLETAKEQVDWIKAESDREGCHKFLLDVRRVDSRLSTMDRFFLGEYIAQVFRYQIKVAVIYREELITRFGENTAVNRGANFRVEATEEAALQWLLRQSESMP